jgi:IS30 family transposase
MNYQQLTEHERYQIYSLNKIGMNKTAIGKQLNRHPSTIGREIKRNTGNRGYRPKQAQRLSDERRVSAVKAIKITDEIKSWIVKLLKQQLSPEQVAAYLKRHKQLSLHHETIYQIIYADKKAGGTLYQQMRIMSKKYRKRYGSYDSRGRIKNRISIDDRPSVVDDKSRIGDWEGDTVMGKGRKSALLTLVERKTLYTMIFRLTGKDATLLAQRAIEGMTPLADKLLTITLDNGLEFARHELITDALGVEIYFAHPYSSWERGINENTNGLIRQYFPKGTDFTLVTDEQVQYVMDQLNNRPRKTRDYKSPSELFTGHRVDLLAA